MTKQLVVDKTYREISETEEVQILRDNLESAAKDFAEENWPEFSYGDLVRLADCEGHCGINPGGLAMISSQGHDGFGFYGVVSINTDGEVDWFFGIPGDHMTLEVAKEPTLRLVH